MQAGGFLLRGKQTSVRVAKLFGDNSCECRYWMDLGSRNVHAGLGFNVWAGTELVVLAVAGQQGEHPSDESQIGGIVLEKRIPVSALISCK